MKQTLQVFLFSTLLSQPLLQLLQSVLCQQFYASMNIKLKYVSSAKQVQQLSTSYIISDTISDYPAKFPGEEVRLRSQVSF